MNPFLERLGFAPETRAVIFHADDLGLCHAANQAFVNIVEQGTVCTGSIMIPCPWSPEMMGLALEYGEKMDIGVHLTLTSEWRSYRWGPVSTRDPSSGLLDADGYFWAGNDALHARMDLDAAAAELRAQVERALQAGVDVTHIDTHMGSVLHPALVPVYVKLGLEFGLPVLLPRLSKAQIMAHGAPEPAATILADQLNNLATSGTLPLLDALTDLDVADASIRSKYPDAFLAYAARIGNLQPGLTHFIYHPALQDAESEAIMPAPWPRRRQDDYATFADIRLVEVLAERGIKVVTYRTLRDIMRAG
ncbi:MAG: polysaccharide deacetylase family protein [Anaerolineae bacterium]|nr:polysaccharide deacetylase family protein [Anaerolineae bacterium]